MRWHTGWTAPACQGKGLKRADNLAEGFHGFFAVLVPRAAVVQAYAVSKPLGR